MSFRPHVAAWSSVWDAIYGQVDPSSARSERFAGWLDHNRVPYAEEIMRAWRDATVRQIRAFEPERVVEVGFGSGMLLFELLPHVASYAGTDISAEAVSLIESALTQAESSRVSLTLQNPGDAMLPFEDGAFDCAVLNSVAQYFPDADYFESVVSELCRVTRSGGHVLLGDMIHASLDGRRRPELWLEPGFAYELPRVVPRIAFAVARLKPKEIAAVDLGWSRYDVVVGIEGADPSPVGPLSRINWSPGSDPSVNDQVLEALSSGDASAVLVEGAPNHRWGGGKSEGTADPEDFVAQCTPGGAHGVALWGPEDTPDRFSILVTAQPWDRQALASVSQVDALRSGIASYAREPSFS